MSSSFDDWNECPAGTLSNVPRAPSGKVSGYPPFAMGVVAGLAACLLMAVFSASFSKPKDQPFATLPCDQVLPRLAELKAGTLDDEMARQCERHLAVCDSCRSAFEALAQRPLPTVPAPSAIASVELQRTALLVEQFQPDMLQ